MKKKRNVCKVKVWLLVLFKLNSSKGKLLFSVKNETALYTDS